MAAAATAFIREHGEAFGDAAALPLTHLARAAASQVKVVLCGEGADELFGGYARYRVSRRLGHTTSVVGPVTRRAAPHWSTRRSGKPWARAVDAVLWGGGVRSHVALLDGDLPLLAATRRAAHRDLVDLLHADWETTTTGAEVDRARAYDRARWLPNVYLEKTDRATMAASLEARVPFLDPIMAAAARGVPRDEQKQPLRDALHRALPDVTLPDRKKGLAVDIVAVVRNHLDDHLTYELSASDSLVNRWCGPAGARRIGDRAKRSPYLLFRLAMLGLWEHEFNGNAFSC
jgi:asparagine synthase (glutamine-hydrolysing)